MSMTTEDPFERIEEVDLKGLPEPVPLFRATR
jgi:hypothetical protein